VLRADYARWPEAPRQVVLRQTSWYLVAGIGLAALLAGLGGDTSVLIRSLAEATLGDDLREQLAWSSAALLLGLPVWALPWRTAQRAAAADDDAGAVERGSAVRKIYLYFFMFVAAVTAMAALVYIVSRLLSVVLGEPAPASMVSDLAQAIAFSLIAAAAWLYHIDALRHDGRMRQREQARRLAGTRVAVVDGCDGHFGRLVIDGLRRELAGMSIIPVGLTPEAAAAMGADDTQPVVARIADGGIIVGPWWLAASGDAATTPDVAAALAASPARKLLAPLPALGWEWVGVERPEPEQVAGQVVRAVRQAVEGVSVRPARHLSGCVIVGVAAAALLLFVVARMLLGLLGSGLF
jgi:hypothetical protein